MAVWNTMAWLLLAAYAFTNTAVIFRLLGAADFGLWATLSAIRGALVLVDGGLSLGVTRDAARDKLDSNVNKRIAAAWWIYIVAGLVVLALAAFLSGLPGLLLRLKPETMNTSRLVTALVGGETAIALAGSPFAAIIRGRQRYDILAAGTFLQATVGIGGLLVLTPAWGLPGAAAASLLARTVSLAGYYYWLRNRTPHLGVRPVPVEVVRSVLRFVAPLWLLAVGSQIAIRSDVPIVAAVYGLIPASHYALGAALPALGAGLLFVILDVAFPRLSALVDRDAARLVRLMLGVGCVVGGLGFGSLALHAETVLRAWVGIAPPLAVSVMAIYSIAWAFNVPAHVLTLTAIGRAQHGSLVPIVMVEAGFNFVLSITLATLWSPSGPAVATLLTLFVSNILIIPAFLLQRLGIPFVRALVPAVSGAVLGVSMSVLVAVLTLSLHLTSPVMQLMFVIVATILAVASVIGLFVMTRTQALRLRASLEGHLLRQWSRLRFGGWAVWRRQRDEGTEARQLLARAREDFPIIWRQSYVPLVTVRIATFNRGHIVADRAIASALAQTYRNIEVVVVGDHCDPVTEHAVRSVRDRRVRFENLPERGAYPSVPLHLWMVAGTAPMNRGLDMARGEWIAPLDDDDEFTPDHVESLLDACRSGSLEFVYGVSEMETRPGQWRRVGAWPPREGRIIHASVMYWSKLGFMRHEIESWRLGEPADWNLWRRMRKAGVKMGFVDRVVCRHYVERRNLEAQGPDSQLRSSEQTLLAVTDI